MVRHVSPVVSSFFAQRDGSLVNPQNFGSRVIESKRPGHQDIRVTAERYLHVYKDRDAAATRALDTLLRLGPLFSR